jgi:predicted PurR-regulated permease PerM
MTVTFSISLIGLLILGIHNAFPIALGIGLVDVIPALGPAAVYVPWAISKIILSDASTAVKLLILYSVVTVIRQLLEPKVVGHHIGIHPLLTMLSLYLGVRFLGLSGILLGTLTAITILAYYKKFSKHQIHEH